LSNCCILLKSALPVASAVLYCLTAVTGLGYDFVVGVGIVAVADSGIVNTKELVRVSAEFCGLCLSGILSRFYGSKPITTKIFILGYPM
jgi:hypothetical protein